LTKKDWEAPGVQVHSWGGKKKGIKEELRVTALEVIRERGGEKDG